MTLKGPFSVSYVSNNHIYMDGPPSPTIRQAADRAEAFQRRYGIVAHWSTTESCRVYGITNPAPDMVGMVEGWSNLPA